MDITGGHLPTVEEIETVWDLPERPIPPVRGPIADLEEAQAQYKADLEVFKSKEKILTWYATDYLSMAVGVESWGNPQKCTSLMTDLAMVQEDVSGKEKVLVPVTSEAFGQVMYKNCRRKWIAVWNYRKTHGPKAKIPKYSKEDQSTHKFEGLWSNPRSGQVEGGGWNSDGLEYLMARMEAIKDVREADKVNDYAKMKHVRSLIQNAMEWKPASKSRKRSAEANNEAVEGAVLRQRVRMVALDE